MQEIINRAKELLADGTVVRVLGWRIGDLPYNPEPSYFETAEDLEANFVYNGFCGANLSKYMIEGSKLEGKTLVFLKPCDTYSFNQLIKENRVVRDKAYIIGIGCKGKLDVEKIKAQGIKGILNIRGVRRPRRYADRGDALRRKDRPVQGRDARALPRLQGQGPHDLRRAARRKHRYEGCGPL